MNKLIHSWDSLETIGPKGNAFKQRKDYTAPFTRTALKYASITSLAISIITIAMAVA
ncbi:hypothetical protein LCGC14_1371550 [marine sediment metagenome]|uniref:Uncharacterized protein n=1 Tax=marine sediment metagenome TaxID=412755 RepID=A0A0F9K5K7_9ZZZZ